MDPVSLLRQAMLPATSERVEGRVESVDAKKGVVTVRLPGGEVVEAGGGGLAEGDKVTLQKNAEGGWIARLQPAMRIPAGSAASTAIPAALLSMGSGNELSQALATGDSSRIRAALSSIALEISAGSSATLPEALVPARNRGLSPLVSLGGASSTSAGTGVPLVLLEELSSGVYGAEAAGRATTLLGASGLPTGSAGLWTESVVNAVASLWLPVDVGDADPPALPAQVAADASGARRLLDSLGVDIPDASDESFRSLVRTLVRATMMGAGDAASDAPVSGGARQAITSGLPSGASPGAAVTVPASTASPKIPVVPAAQAAQATAALSLESFPSRESAAVSAWPALAAASRESEVAQEQAGLLAEPGMAPSDADAVDATRRLSLSKPPSPSPATPSSDEGRVLATLVRGATDPLGEIAPRSAAATSDPERPVPRNSGETPRSLSAAAALRVACAWALSPQEPSDEVLAAAVGAALDVPEAVHRLAEHAARAPSAFPEVSAFLARTDDASPLLPHRLGFGKGVHSDDDSRPLSHAIAGDLARALSEDRGADAQVLREALRGFVGEGLDAAKDPSNPMASAPWTMPPRGERPDAGRLVVRDRRRTRDGATERTVVEVTMNPTGLGTVGARLEAVGKELDVRFRTSEPATAERIRQALPELRQILTGLGYGTRELGVEDGRPSAPSGEPRRPGSAGFLDIRA